MPYRENIAQVDGEIDRFTEILAEENVRSYLEIGSKFGGSLWRVANALPPGSRIVSVDMPGGTKLWKESEASLKACIAELCAIGYDAHVIWGDSTDPAVIRAVTELGPFDACFIDGNHTRPYLNQDFANYAMLCRVAGFPDIAWHRAPEWKGTRIDAKPWWDERKAVYRHEEIKLCPTGKNNGIGVIWR